MPKLTLDVTVDASYNVSFLNVTGDITSIPSNTFIATSNKIDINLPYGTYNIGTITVTNGSCSDTINNVSVTCVATTTSCSIVNRVDIRFRYAGEGDGSGNQWAMNRLIGCKIQGSNDAINWNDIFVFTQSFVSTNFTSAQSGVLTPVNFTNTTPYKYVSFTTNGSNGAYTYYDDLDLVKFYNGTNLLTGTNNGTGGNWSNAFDTAIDTKWGIPDTNIYRAYTQFACDGGILPPPTPSSNILKTFLLTDIGGARGINEVLWGDNSYHDHYWNFNRSNPPTPPSKTTLPNNHTAVSDIKKIREICDYWSALGGDSISVPVFWDRTHYGATTYEFRQYQWILNYAGSKGLKVGLWLKPNRQMGVDYYNQTVDPNNSWQDQTSSSWSFEPTDAEHWSNGHLMSGVFDHRIALGSSKWNNYYDYVTALVTALEPYKQHILYFSLGGNNTLEEDFQMNDTIADGTFNQATINQFNTWYFANYGTPAPSMISYRTSDSTLLRRIIKFHAYTRNEKVHTVSDLIKAVIPSAKIVVHYGSITDGANIYRGNLVNIPHLNFSKVDGIKQNDERIDAAFQAKVAAKLDKMNILETTNDPLAAPTAQDMINNVKRCIDKGAVTGISFAFFEGAESGNTQRKNYLETVVNDLKNTGYWSKNSTSPNTPQNMDNIQLHASAVMNNGGNYISTYLSAFTASENSHGGHTPSLEIIDDI